MLFYYYVISSNLEIENISNTIYMKDWGLTFYKRYINNKLSTINSNRAYAKKITIYNFCSYCIECILL